MRRRLSLKWTVLTGQIPAAGQDSPFKAQSPSHQKGRSVVLPRWRVFFSQCPREDRSAISRRVETFRREGTHTNIRTSYRRGKGRSHVNISTGDSNHGPISLMSEQATGWYLAGRQDGPFKTDTHEKWQVSHTKGRAEPKKALIRY